MPITLLALSLLSASGPGPIRERLTIDDAVHLALEQNELIRAAREQRDAAQSTATSVAGRLLPSVAVSDELQHYRTPYSAAVTLPGAPASFSFPIREQNTNSFAVAAQQPVTGLLHLSYELSAAGRAADGKASAVSVAEASVAEGVRTTYLRLFHARATIEIARASVRQLEEQIQVARSKLSAGALVNADVLRLEVAAANARQQLIQAEAQAQVTRANLLAALGEGPDDEVEFVEPTELENADLDLARFEVAAPAAASRRPETAQAEAEADGAQRGATARLLDLMPEVSLEAAYVRVDGQALAQRESTYIGAKASWPVWDWGARFFAHRSAEHQAASARLNASHQRRQVDLDVSSKLAQARAAVNAVNVAETAIANAEEAYRVTDALIQAGSGTTTDLLDAQAALTQARLNLSRARYDRAIARVALARATGL